MPNLQDLTIVTSSLRLLLLSPAPIALKSENATSSTALILKALTGVPPTEVQINSGFAGYTTHAPLQLKTRYYNASIGIWCDEVGDEWKETMADAAEDAREVRSAIGAIAFVLNRVHISSKENAAKALNMLEQIEEVRAMCEDEGDGREIVGVAVLVGEDVEDKLDEIEEGLRGERGVFGWDVIAWDGKAEEKEEKVVKNDYGEKVAIERVKEILEAVPWTTKATDEGDFLDSENDADWTTSEQRELDQEMMGLKMDLRDEENDEQEVFGEDEWPELRGGSGDFKVEQLQGLMERLIATREAASELNGAEKQKFAKREVERIIREMG